MKNLREIVITRLAQLGLGAVEAATAAGIERTYIRDIVEEKKKSIRSDKLAGLARALHLNAEALARGELLADDVPSSPDDEMLAEFIRLLPLASPEARQAALTTLRLGQPHGSYSEPEPETKDRL